MRESYKGTRKRGYPELLITLTVVVRHTQTLLSRSSIDISSFLIPSLDTVTDDTNGDTIVVDDVVITCTQHGGGGGRDCSTESSAGETGCSSLITVAEGK